MVFVVTSEVTPATKTSLILEQKLSRGIRTYNIPVKIDQMRFIFDAVRIMADRTGGLFFNDMLLMLGKTCIIKDTVSVVALITQGIRCQTLR